MKNHKKTSPKKHVVHHLQSAAAPVPMEKKKHPVPEEEPFQPEIYKRFQAASAVMPPQRTKFGTWDQMEAYVATVESLTGKKF